MVPPVCEAQAFVSSHQISRQDHEVLAFPVEAVDMRIISKHASASVRCSKRILAVGCSKHEQFHADSIALNSAADFLCAILKTVSIVESCV